MRNTRPSLTRSGKPRPPDRLRITLIAGRPRTFIRKQVIAFMEIVATARSTSGDVAWTGSVSGCRSGDKGADGEHPLARLLRQLGIAKTKIRRVRRSATDISMPLLDTNKAVEVKSRAGGFSQLSNWLNHCAILIVKADYRVVVRLSLAAEIAKRTS